MTTVARLAPVWLVLAVLGGCVDKTGFTVVKNTCLMDVECADAGAVCDLELQQCMRERVDEPYQVLLHVRAGTSTAELPAGESLVEEMTDTPFVLDRAVPDKVLRVPLSQRVTGRVTRADGEQTVEARLTFVPEDQTVPVSSPTPVNTPRTTEPADNLSVNLNPGVRYVVRVQPLIEDSRTLAPFTTSYTVTEDDTSGVVFAFPEMAQRGGVLRNQAGVPLRNYRVRLEDKVSGAILSTTATTLAGGRFELYAPTSVMESQAFNVVVSVEPFPLWSVTIAIDGSRLVPNVVLTLPNVPAPVEYQGSVEAATEGKGAPAAYAAVTFTSRFTVPEESDDPSIYWCRSNPASSGPAPLCTAQVVTSTDASGRFSVPLPPGDYDVFISPSPETGGRRAPLSTTHGGAAVRTQAGGGPHAGPRFELARAIRFEGLVQSPGRVPMPNVTVSARPLSFPDPEEDVFKYARPASAVTARRGTFELDVDRGYFDLIVEPPSESGFAWVHSLNRIVRGVPEGPVGPLRPSPPVPVRGRVLVEYDDTPLPGAVVEAYALIRKKPAGQRAVRIAQTVTDDAGVYRLALPPAVRAEEPPDADPDAGLDAGSSESRRYSE